MAQTALMLSLRESARRKLAQIHAARNKDEHITEEPGIAFAAGIAMGQMETIDALSGAHILADAPLDTPEQGDPDTKDL